MSKVVKTDWLSHVQNVLKTSLRISNYLVKKEANVLVYCTKGNKATPVITSLTQIFCDKYYRTFEGFKVLVHKEWCYYLYNF